MLRLRVVPATGSPFDYRLEDGSVIVGRSKKEAGLTISDRFLSRRHALLQHRDGVWFAEDLGSRNGTLVNGSRIDGATQLAPGDEIRMSASVISVLGDHDDGDGMRTVYRSASDLIDSESAVPIDDDAAPEDYRRAAARLRILNEVHRALAGPIELEELLELILARAFEHLRPEEGVIFLRGPDGDFFRAALRTAPEAESEQTYSTTLIHEVAEKGLAALVLDTATDERFAGAKSILNSGVRSLAAAPLLDSRGSLGMIALSSRLHRRSFDEQDLELLVSLASVAALRIRNVALAKEAAERQRFEDEVRLARQIQVALLPSHLPKVEGYELFAGNVPSRGVSGDYYLVVSRAGAKECLLMLADVSGKGIAASLLTASLEALAVEPIETGDPPDEIFTKVSRRLFERTPPAKYATAFVAALTTASGELAFANAGHNPGLLVRASGEIERLGPTGHPLGLLPATTYEARAAQLESGDLLVLYTDGITEAESTAGEEFGLERLEKLCRELRSSPLPELGKLLDDRLQAFVGGAAFGDDRTLVLLRRDRP